MERFTQAPNILMDALCYFDIPGKERQVLNVIMRKTYGWHKEEDAIALSQFAQMTGMDRSNIAKHIKSLVAKKIILKGVSSATTGNINKYRINERIWEWTMGWPKKGVVSSATPTKETSISLGRNASWGKRTDEVVREFFSLFPGGKTIQTFDDAKKGRKNLVRVLHFTECSEGDMLQMKGLNEMGAGIYLTINETDLKGRTKDNIIKVRSLFADLDGIPIGPVLGYDPSLVVETSPSRYHCYWFSSQVPLDGFSEMQKSIIRTFKADPSVHDLPRVLRVPGFYNKKDEEHPFFTSIIGGSAKDYLYKDLVEMFPPDPRIHMAKYILQKNGGVRPNDQPYTGPRGNVHGKRNVSLTRRIGGAIANGLSWEKVREEAYLEGAESTPPMDLAEIETTLGSMRKVWEREQLRQKNLGR